MKLRLTFEYWRRSGLESRFFYLRKTNLKIIINEKQQLYQTAVITCFFMEDYTHYLICFENVGNGKKRRYFDLCKILRIGTNGKPYLEVKSKNGKVVKRYAESERLISIYEDC